MKCLKGKMRTHLPPFKHPRVRDFAWWTSKWCYCSECQFGTILMNKSFQDTPTAHNWHVWWWYNRCFACVFVHVVLDIWWRKTGCLWAFLIRPCGVLCVQYCHVLVLNCLTYWVATWKIFRLHFLMVVKKSLNFNRSCIFRVPASDVGLPECNWKMCLKLRGPHPKKMFLLKPSRIRKKSATSRRVLYAYL